MLGRHVKPGSGRKRAVWPAQPSPPGGYREPADGGGGIVGVWGGDLFIFEGT